MALAKPSPARVTATATLDSAPLESPPVSASPHPRWANSWKRRSDEVREAELRQVKDRRQRIAVDNWHDRLEEAVQFRLDHGNYVVRQKCKPLGPWVNKQREHMKFYDKGEVSSMTLDRYQLLELVEFCRGRNQEDVWNAHFLELKAFKQKYGHCNVGTRDPDNSTLGRWATTQRSHYMKWCHHASYSQKLRVLTDERIAKLKSIGFRWSMFNRASNDAVEHYDSETAASSVPGKDRGSQPAPAGQVVEKVSREVTDDGQSSVCNRDAFLGGESRHAGFRGLP